MITVEALTDAITQRIDVYNNNDAPINNRGTQTCDLLASKNRILASNITSSFDVPRQNLSAMDGYALAIGSKLDENATISIIGESKAGQAFDGNLVAGQGVRIFTGAVVPSGCDTVVMQENTNFSQIKDSIDKSKPYDVTLTQSAKPNSNIRKQGEEIEAGEVVLRKGKRLNPADISLMANLGIDKVSVYQPLVVGILATGDELVAVGNPLDSLAQIYNSNTPTLKSLLSEMPVTIKDYGIIADNMDATVKAVHQAVHECDVLISTAGVSVGDYDFLTTVIEQLGQINHYKVAMKPGKPFVFGELNVGLEGEGGTKGEDGTKSSTHQQPAVLYFGLPGNPLSAVVGTLMFIMPALWQLSGVNKEDMPLNLSIKATLNNEVKKSVGRMDFQRGVLAQNSQEHSQVHSQVHSQEHSQVHSQEQEHGNFTVTPFAKQQSHRIKQLSQANCFIVLPLESGNVPAGEVVEVLPFPWA